MSYFIERGWAQPGGIEERIERLFDKDANKIARSSIENHLTVVTGPFGNGKSRCLIPLTSQLIRERGLECINEDAQGYTVSDKKFPEVLVRKVAQTQKGVFILDEAGAVGLYGGSKKINETFSLVKEKGYNLTAVIAYPAENYKLRAEATAAWTEATKQLTGKDPKIINLERFYLNRDLAKEYILDYHQKTEGQSSMESVEYLLDTIPYNLQLLDNARFALRVFKTPQEVCDYLAGAIETWKSLFTPKEYKSTSGKLNKDWTKFRNIKY